MKTFHFNLFFVTKFRENSEFVNPYFEVFISFLGVDYTDFTDFFILSVKSVQSAPKE